MTRFQASGPRVRYTPVESEKPFKQIVGLYNMWQSLSPETREWIGNLFRRKGKVTSQEPALDPSLMDLRGGEVPELGSEEAVSGTNEMLTSGYESPYKKPMRLDWNGILVEAKPIDEIPSTEEIMATGRMEKPRYRAIAGMSPAVEQFFTGDNWRVR